jgi:hypothetical protein
VRRESLSVRFIEKGLGKSIRNFGSEREAEKTNSGRIAEFADGDVKRRLEGK